MNLIRKWLLRNPKLNPYEIFKFGFSKAITSPFGVLPDFMIIGAAKSGTTSLYDNLIQHPDIYPAFRKEIHYFDLHKTGWYRSNFPSIFLKNKVKRQNRKFLTGEATANYLFFPNAPKLISKITPKSKFIVILRNPIDRAYSQYQHQLRKKLVPPRDNIRETLSFEDAIKYEQTRLAGEWEKISKDKSYSSEKFRNFSYLSRGVYVEQLKNWFNVFPKEQFLILKTEDFNETPQKILNEIFEFLGVSSFECKNSDRLNVGKYEKMNSSIRKYLSDYYKPYNTKLYDLLERNFDWD